MYMYIGYLTCSYAYHVLSFLCFSFSLYFSPPTFLAYHQYYISVQPPSERDVLALEILSYIGYGITFVCLVAVIVIFVSFKPLWGLRTYIHIHLCVNLLIALFITAFGMDKEKPYEKVCLFVRTATSVPWY